MFLQVDAVLYDSCSIISFKSISSLKLCFLVKTMGGTSSLQLSAEDWEDELDSLRSEWHKPLYSGTVCVVWQAVDGDKVNYYIILTDTCVLFFQDKKQYEETLAGKLHEAPAGIELHETTNFLVVHAEEKIKIEDSSSYTYATIYPGADNKSLEDLSEYMSMVVQSTPSNREEASNAQFLEADDSGTESVAEDDMAAQASPTFHSHQDREDSVADKGLNHLITVKNKKRYCKVRNNVLLCYKTAESMNKNLHNKRFDSNYDN